MTGRDPETLLRDALTEETSDISADPAFVNATVDHSVGALRRTRARNLALAGAATAVVVALVAWQAPSLVNSSSEQPTKQPDQSKIDQSRFDHAHIDNASDWALSLPRGADADAAYIDGHTLVVGTKQIDLGPGTFGNLVGTLPGGWFADIGATDSHGNTTRPVYGELRTDGTFFPYDYQPTDSAVGGVAISPGGAQVAYGDAVVSTGFTSSGFDDVAMGTKTADLPAGASDIVEWNSAVLVYRDAQHRAWAWSPGTTAERLRYDDVVAGGYGYHSDGDCVVVRNYALNSAYQSYRLCGHGDPLTISSGKRVLMSSGEFVNLEAGVDFLTLPAAVEPSQLQLLWESGDSLILVVHPTGDRPAPAVLVRCVVSAGLCERASGSIASYPELQAIPGSGQ